MGNKNSGLRPKSHKQFTDELSVANPLLKLIGKYVKANQYVVIEDGDGIKYRCSPFNLLKGKIPSMVSAIDKRSAFEIKARKTHGDKYDYSLVNYTKNSNKVDIICPVHGVFSQVAHTHISGCQCPRCNCGYLTRKDWMERAGEKPAVMYLLHLTGEGEDFYKVGITTRSANERMSRGHMKPYKGRVLSEIHGTGGEIYESEQKLHRLLNAYKYTPNHKFGGWSECYTLEGAKLSYTILDGLEHGHITSPIAR